MEIRKFFGCFAAAAVAVLCAACSSSGGQPQIPANPAAGPVAPALPPPAGPKHLYVIVTTARDEVAEYPIEGGIPQATPDRVVRGLVAPNALAVDGAGRLYVLDLQIIKEFAAGASGRAHPIREIDVPSKLNINTLAVDAAGYVYVGQSHNVYMYAPGAHGHAKPVAVIDPVGYPAGLTFDGAGDLYVQANTQPDYPRELYRTHVSIYAPPPSRRRIREFCGRKLPDEGIMYGVALDGRRLLTTHTYFIDSAPFGEVDVFNADADTCPTRRIATITTSNPSLLEPVYLAVDPPYLYVCDVEYANGGAIFTLRTTGSRQKPLSILNVAGGHFHDVFGIALGP